MAAVTAQERGRLARLRLLQTARMLIGEVGWSKVTTRLVAERAAVAPGVVHYHYASVNELLMAASCAYIDELLTALGQKLSEQPDLDGGIGWLLGQVQTGHASLLVVETYLAAVKLPELRERLHTAITGFRQVVAGWLRAHGYEGDAQAAAIVVTAASDGLILQRSLDPGLDPAALIGPLRAMLRPEWAS